MLLGSQGQRRSRPTLARLFPWRIFPARERRSGMRSEPVVPLLCQKDSRMPTSWWSCLQVIIPLRW